MCLPNSARDLLTKYKFLKNLTYVNIKIKFNVKIKINN